MTWSLFKSKAVAKPTPVEAVSPFDDGDIHIMPKQYYVTAPAKGLGRQTRWLIIGGVVVVVLVAGVIFFSVDWSARNRPTVVTSTPSPAVNQVNNETAPESLVEEETTGAEEASPVVVIEADETDAATNETPGVAPAVTPNDVIPQNGGVALQLATGRDADRDGLTDVEEILYGSDRTKPDTDLDGYLDGAEVRAGYSPTGINQKLTDGGLVKVYSDKTDGYQVTYPGLWRVDTPGSTETVTFISPTTTDFIEVTRYGNVTTSLERWYQEVIAPVANAGTPAPTAETLKTWRMIRTADQLTIYLKSAKTNAVYAITYNPGSEKELHFSSTFAMVINGLTEVIP